MKEIKYFLQFLIIIFLFFIYKILGLKNSLMISGNIFSFLGPLFRSKKICEKNLSYAFPNISKRESDKIIKKMWNNYGKIFAEYSFIKNFRSSKLDNYFVEVENQKYLEEIKQEQKPVIFISGHFDNFELMAMHIEKSGIDLAAIYRPLNNFFLNPLMENIRRKYICKKQIKKGITGTRQILSYFKNGSSIALMIDQRVSEGIKVDLFNKKALTTTIPAQFSKKFNVKIVPIHIARDKENNFKLKIHKPISFEKDQSIQSITLKLNNIIETMIISNPSQWIWTHNRWK